MELRVKQLLQPLTIAPNSRVVEFDFKGSEFLEERGHWSCVLCGLTFELSWRQRHGALDSKRKMGRSPSA